MVIFYIGNLHVYFFVWIQHGFLANIVFALGPSKSAIQRWCIQISGQLLYNAL